MVLLLYALVLPVFHCWPKFLSFLARMQESSRGSSSLPFASHDIPSLYLLAFDLVHRITCIGTFLVRRVESLVTEGFPDDTTCADFLSLGALLFRRESNMTFSR